MPDTKEGMSKADILGLNDLDVEAVNIPDWPKPIYVRSLTGAERDRFQDQHISADGTFIFQNARAHLVVLAVCDKDGKRLFDDSDLPEIQKKNARWIGTVADHIIKTSGLLDVGLTLDVESAEKNS